eukprot:scaffold135635_cov22-Tisochrysis_lutea.AAC.1
MTSLISSPCSAVGLPSLESTTQRCSCSLTCTSQQGGQYFSVCSPLPQSQLLYQPTRSALAFQDMVRAVKGSVTDQ